MIGSYQLLSIPYQPDSANQDHQTDHLEYTPYRSKNATPNPTSFSNEEIEARFLLHKFSTSGNFVPERLEVRASAQNGNMERIVILSKDRHHYQVFSFDGDENGVRQVDAENDDVVMSGGS